MNGISISDLIKVNKLRVFHFIFFGFELVGKLRIGRNIFGMSTMEQIKRRFVLKTIIFFIRNWGQGTENERDTNLV